MKQKILLLILAALFFSGYTGTGLAKESRALLGTIVEITVADQDKPHQAIEEATQKAFQEIGRIENLLSKFKATSDIGRINSWASTRPVRVSPETVDLIKQSIYFSRLSHGAFDITVQPLMQAWGFEDTAQKSDKPAQLSQIATEVGYQNIELQSQQNTVFLTRPGLGLDLGAIAKGYAVDKAIEVFKAAGIKNVLVNAGGDIYALGRPQATKKWQIALQHPRKKDTILTILELENRAVATSGDYERYVQLPSGRYSHIINPKTAQPCVNNVASVTVLSANCSSADALATTVFVCGAKDGLGLIEGLNDTEVIIIETDDQGLPDSINITTSSGLKELRF